MATRGTNQWRLDAWGDACAVTPVVFTFTGGQRIQVHPLLVPACEQLDQVFVAHHYQVRRAGCYNCRRITGGSTMSSHAWATAIDVNDDTNPYRLDKLVTDMPRELVADLTNIRTVDGVPVFRWGGDWDGRPETPNSNYDSMHIECVATPDELRRGLAPLALVGGTSKTPPPLTPRTLPVLKRGSEGPPVLFLQWLVQLDSASGAGQFGPRTDAMVRQYQASRGMLVDGVVGPATWTALLTAAPPLAPGQPKPQRIPGAAVAA